MPGYFKLLNAGQGQAGQSPGGSAGCRRGQAGRARLPASRAEPNRAGLQRRDWGRCNRGWCDRSRCVWGRCNRGWCDRGWCDRGRWCRVRPRWEPPAPRLAARPAPPRLASPRRGRRLREQRERVPARSWPRCARGRAAGAMGQLCCFPFSRGEEKIGECGGSALPCASAGCAAAPGSLQLRKAGWRARGAFLGGLLVLLS